LNQARSGTSADITILFRELMTEGVEIILRQTKEKHFPPAAGHL
jgi:hypothetical protein